MTAANRGKSAEKAVSDYLKAYDSKTKAFDWARSYDAHSAGGRFNRQCYDFAVYMPDWHGGIEVKEVAHDFRIPHGNFGLDQVAKLYKRQLAGGYVVVLIHHSTSKKWRVAPLAEFRIREGGSWDLQRYKEYTSCAEALDSLGVFR